MSDIIGYVIIGFGLGSAHREGTNIHHVLLVLIGVVTLFVFHNQ
jgi:hypothetical protein